MILPTLARPAAAAAAFLLLGAASQPSKQAQPSGIDVVFEKLRSSKGVVRLCLTRNPAHYPDCSGDPQARQVNIPADSGTHRFNSLPQGTYAMTALHDENANGELDTFLGIPREGFAFSNNPRVGFGPPRYDRVRFNIGPARALVRLQFRYIG